MKFCDVKISKLTNFIPPNFMTQNIFKRFYIFKYSSSHIDV